MKATETSILSFIGGLDKVFIIPPFQRNYEWSDEQCIELFEDIIKAYKNKKNHYLGNIVYYLGENNGASYNEYILVDGQQRVSTILILLCALRDTTTDESIVNSINKRYLINDTDNNKFRVRLKQTSYDQKVFISIVDKKNFNLEHKENNIYKNYKKFIKLIENSDLGIKEIYETINRLEIVDVNLQIENDLEAVQIIFEKINSTGKKLDPADLIRNFLLLSSSSKEQEKLYEDYWIPIENKVKNQNISKFSKNYLTLNILGEVSEARIYKEFKEHFKNSGKIHEEILKEMEHYSKYYEWIRFEKSLNKKINKILEVLNFMKSDDFYPLYLYLFEKVYDKNQDKLLKILKLIRDFIIRYRVVSPSGGGGTVSLVVFNLLKKLKEIYIENSYEKFYETILYELSNSSTPSGRFPNDIEFKEALMNSVGNNYAKIILLIVEEKESLNIPVPFSEVTVEHLMPQTLSENWKDYLGGKEQSEQIYEKYIDCIGNKAPISGKYNSKLSNKIWNEKKIYLKDVQFRITSEVCKYDEWKEKDIEKRNLELAEKACEYITSPLDRTRKYQTKIPSDEFIEGVYSVSDIETPMEGKNVEYIIFNEENIMVSSWKEFFVKICELAYKEDQNKFVEIVESNVIHKRTKKRNFPNNDPVITSNKNLLVLSIKIENTDYFSEGTLSSIGARVYAKQLLDFYDLSEKVQIYVK